MAAGATMIEAAVMAAVEEAAEEEEAMAAGMEFELLFCDTRLMRACSSLKYFFGMALDTTIADAVDTKKSSFSRAVPSRLLAHLPAFLVLAQFVALVPADINSG
jgi:hypothetical protein